MDNVATSVRITGDANVVATSLAQRMGSSKARVIEVALRALEERLFWDDVKAAYAGLAEDVPGLARYRQEIAEWDETLQDGLSAIDGPKDDR
jgi:predicted transcriptional regulator